MRSSWDMGYVGIYCSWFGGVRWSKFVCMCVDVFGYIGCYVFECVWWWLVWYLISDVFIVVVFLWWVYDVWVLNEIMSACLWLMWVVLYRVVVCWDGFGWDFFVGAVLWVLVYMFMILLWWIGFCSNSCWWCYCVLWFGICCHSIRVVRNCGVDRNIGSGWLKYGLILLDRCDSERIMWWFDVDFSALLSMVVMLCDSDWGKTRR